jgi:hypothetical protein
VSVVLTEVTVAQPKTLAVIVVVVALLMLEMVVIFSIYVASSQKKFIRVCN